MNPVMRLATVDSRMKKVNVNFEQNSVTLTTGLSFSMENV